MAAMASYSDANIDLKLYQPLQGASDGFGPAPLAISSEPAGRIDFVLVNDNGGHPASIRCGRV